MKTAVITIFWAFLSLGSAHSGQFVIKLPEKVTVLGPKVSLGEISEVLGETPYEIEKLRRLFLLMAPPAGRTFNVSTGLIKREMLKAGYDIKNVHFEGSGGVLVEAKGQDYSVAKLLPDLKAFILSELQEPAEEVEIRISNPEKKVQLPWGKISAKFRSPSNGRFEGLLLLTVELEIEGRLVKVLPLRVEVRVSRAVLVSKARIEKGEAFSEQNVEVARRERIEVPSDAIGNIQNVLGRKAAKTLLPNTVLRVDSIFDPPVIRQGKTVKALVNRGNVEIVVDVRAVDNGKIGDVIRVENTQTKKVFRGKVIDERNVLIESN